MLAKFVKAEKAGCVSCAIFAGSAPNFAFFPCGLKSLPI